MRQRKYTLPRHTILAGQGPRVGAFLIDLATSLALFLAFLFGCFRFVFNFKTQPLGAKLDDERIKSALFFPAQDGKLDYYGSANDNVEFRNALKYFYTEYIPEVSEDKDKPVIIENDVEVKKSEYFTVEWFNKNVLKVESDGRAYFEYVGEDKTIVANIKADVDAKTINVFLQNAWKVANKDFNNLPTIKKINNQFGFYNSLEAVLSAILATSIVYIVVPFVLKNGVTFGKKAFGLSLATKDGYVIENYQLFMRIMPLFVIILAMLIPIWRLTLTVAVVFTAFFLVSFTLSMASPKKCSLHDFTARTIVVDQRRSILFKDAAEEEDYIAKEDNLEVGTEYNGEEPDLKYERWINKY